MPAQPTCTSARIARRALAHPYNRNASNAPNRSPHGFQPNALPPHIKFSAEGFEVCLENGEDTFASSTSRCSFSCDTIDLYDSPSETGKNDPVNKRITRKMAGLERKLTEHRCHLRTLELSPAEVVISNKHIKSLERKISTLSQTRPARQPCTRTDSGSETADFGTSDDEAWKPFGRGDVDVWITYVNGIIMDKICNPWSGPTNEEGPASSKLLKGRLGEF